MRKICIFRLYLNTILTFMAESIFKTSINCCSINFIVFLRDRTPFLLLFQYQPNISGQKRNFSCFTQRDLASSIESQFWSSCVVWYMHRSLNSYHSQFSFKCMFYLYRIDLRNLSINDQFEYYSSMQIDLYRILIRLIHMKMLMQTNNIAGLKYWFIDEKEIMHVNRKVEKLQFLDNLKLKKLK